jgi:PAS domain S-box-containing protein
VRSHNRKGGGASPKRAATAKRRGRPAGAARAVTPRNLTREAYRQVYDVGPVIWLVLDAAGIIVDINRAGSQALGERIRFLRGTPLRMWLDGESRAVLTDHLHRCRESAEMVECNLRLRRPATVRLYTRKFVMGDVRLFPSVAIDITEHLQMERARRTAERERDLADQDRRLARAAEAAKDRMIATVSHELRNPLSPALMAAATLTAWPGLPDRVREMAAVIKRNIQLEARLIDDLLDVARATRGQLDLRKQVLDVHEVIHNAVAAVAGAASDRRVTITVDLGACERLVHADATRLQQVFWNLLTNAVKFSEPGGQVLVRSVGRPDQAIVVTVRDFGVGIEEPALEKLFSPFERPRAPAGGRAGLGLGLSIARNIVELHGGQIWASSEGPGKGTTVEVDLPLASSQVSVDRPAHDDTPAAVQATTRGTALVVEDHRDSGTMMAACLSQQGYDVTLVMSRAEALAALDRHFDVVISDLGLGDGSGLEVARAAVAANEPPLHLIALSGFGTLRDIEASYDAGFDHHLVKPLDPAQLIQLLNAGAGSASARHRRDSRSADELVRVDS